MQQKQNSDQSQKQKSPEFKQENSKKSVYKSS